jgi:hypothetical protein
MCGLPTSPRQGAGDDVIIDDPAVGHPWAAGAPPAAGADTARGDGPRQFASAHARPKRLFELAFEAAHLPSHARPIASARESRHARRIA